MFREILDEIIFCRSKNIERDTSERTKTHNFIYFFYTGVSLSINPFFPDKIIGKKSVSTDKNKLSFGCGLIVI